MTLLAIILLALCAGAPTALLLLPPQQRKPAPVAPMFDAEDWRQMSEYLTPNVYAWCREQCEQQETQP